MNEVRELERAIVDADRRGDMGELERLRAEYRRTAAVARITRIS
jgi:hypothetical protein